VRAGRVNGCEIVQEPLLRRFADFSLYDITEDSAALALAGRSRAAN